MDKIHDIVSGCDEEQKEAILACVNWMEDSVVYNVDISNKVVRMMYGESGLNDCKFFHTDGECRAVEFSHHILTYFVHQGTLMTVTSTDFCDDDDDDGETWYGEGNFNNSGKLQIMSYKHCAQRFIHHQTIALKTLLSRLQLELGKDADEAYRFHLLSTYYDGVNTLYLVFRYKDSNRF